MGYPKKESYGAKNLAEFASHLRKAVDAETARAIAAEETKIDASSLAAVATSGKYEDLLDKPPASDAVWAAHSEKPPETEEEREEILSRLAEGGILVAGGGKPEEQPLNNYSVSAEEEITEELLSRVSDYGFVTILP